MIANINPMKSAVTSIISVIAGSSYNYCNVTLAHLSLSAANTAFQHLAWTTAILAGIVSIINGVRKWKHNPKTKSDDSQD
jgi:hypothetical protein